MSSQEEAIRTSCRHHLAGCLKARTPPSLGDWQGLALAHALGMRGSQKRLHDGGDGDK
jgi:hypothetical protein